MLAVIMGYSTMLSISLNQDAPFEHVFSGVAIIERLPALFAVDTACMCNRQDVVNLSSKHQKRDSSC